MARGRLALVVAAVAVTEAVALLLLRPPGQRLRPLVDLWAMEGLLLAIAGAFLVAERPFLAARLLARRGEKESEPDPARAARRRANRATGVVLLVLGVALFAAAAGVWALARA